MGSLEERESVEKTNLPDLYTLFPSWGRECGTEIRLLSVLIKTPPLPLIQPHYFVTFNTALEWTVLSV